MPFSCRKRMVPLLKIDTVLFVKWEFAALSLSTSGDLMQPDHNAPYQ